MNLKTEKDYYVVFDCGHEELNPAAYKKGAGGYICAQCERRRLIDRAYLLCQGAGCSAVVERTGRHGRARLCPECRAIKKQEADDGRAVRMRTPEAIKDIEPQTSLSEIAQALYDEGYDSRVHTKEHIRQVIVRAMRKVKTNYVRLYGEPGFGEHIEPWQYAGRAR